MAYPKIHCPLIWEGVLVFGYWTGICLTGVSSGERGLQDSILVLKVLLESKKRTTIERLTFWNCDLTADEDRVFTDIVSMQ